MFQPLMCGTELLQCKVVNIMAAGALAPCVVRQSAPMVSTRIGMFLSYMGNDFSCQCPLRVEKGYNKL